LNSKQCSNEVPCPWNASVSLARFYQPLAGYLCKRDSGKVFTSLWLVIYASGTLADLSGETPEFRALEFCCIILVKMSLNKRKPRNPGAFYMIC